MGFYEDRGLGNSIINSSNTDKSGISQANSIFGDGITASRIPTGVGQFFYGIDDRFADPEVTGGGSITITGGTGFENLLTLSSSTTASSTAKTQNTEYLRYVPGYEFGVYFTMAITPPTGDGFVKAGLWDGENGFWIGYKEDSGQQKFGIAREKDDTEFFVSQENFNIDKLDGAGSSKLNIDTSKGNVFRIRGGYLGYATVLFEILLPSGETIPFHKIEYPNSSDQTHISNTNLPARIKVSNGTTAEDVVVKIGSYCIYTTTDSASVGVNDRNFSLGISNISLNGTGGYDRRTVISFKNPSTFQGNLMPSAKENRIPALLKFFSLALAGQNKTGLLEIIQIDSSLNLGGTFTPKDSGNSLLSYSTNATYNYDGTEEILFADTFDTTSDKIDLFLAELKLLLNPAKDAVFVISSTTVQDIDATFSNAWSEQF